MYCDLTVNNVSIVSTGIVLDRVRIVRQPYLGFVGDIAVCDTQGVSDPTHDGLGARYLLVYLEAGDL
jgi:hypothetical protein